MKLGLSKLHARLGSLGAAGLALLAFGCAPAASPPVENPPAPEESRPPTAEERARALVAQMTLEEKMAYIGGDREFYIRPIERLGIPEIKMADGPVGCRNWGPSTAYPASIALAASFDPELSKQVGKSIARDCRARGVHILLAPGTNIQRSPLNGRNFEYLGEDPLVARDHAVHFIQGVQSGGVMATVKHFVANNQEWDRHHVSSEVSERALHEIYFPAFEGAVKDGNVGAVMSSYNLVNGAYASHNSYLLRDILRKRWGFSGIVMSDWSAVYDALGGVRGGTDLEMPFAQAMNPQALQALLDAGTITEADIDEKVFHILSTLIRFGFLDSTQLQERPVDDPESAQVALAAARKSIVLLKNERVDDEPTLPLDAEQKKTIAVIGPNATPAVHGGSGSAYTVPPHVVSLLDGIKQAAPRLVVVHHPGIMESTGFGHLGAAVFAGPVKQEVFLGKDLAGDPVSTSDVDRINLLVDGGPPVDGVPGENYSIRWTGHLKVETAGKYQLMTNADDGVRVFLDDELVIDDFTDHAPRMREVELPLKRGEHRIKVEYFQGILGSICQFGFGKRVEPGQLTGKKELLSAVKDADIVIVAVGYGQSADTNSMGTAYKPYWPPEWARKATIVEAEDDDRGFSLPQPQVETILALEKLNKKTIVVGFSGGGIDFEPWLDHVQGLIWAWYPGQEGGTALSEVLFGKNDPSGRLPVTFAKKYADHPAANSYGLRLDLGEEKQRDGQGHLDACATATQSTLDAPHPRSERGQGPLYASPYCEDVFVGYRGFDRNQVEPLFPFGFGLSYAAFNYSGLEVESVGDDVVARVTVANTSKRAGAEVVQFYAAPLSNGAPGSTPRVPQQLAGYQTIHLEPGEEVSVEVKLNPRAFGLFETGKNSGWVIPKGSYEVRASRSSRHHLQTAIIQLQQRRL